MRVYIVRSNESTRMPVLSVYVPTIYCRSQCKNQMLGKCGRIDIEFDWTPIMPYTIWLSAVAFKLKHNIFPHAIPFSHNRLHRSWITELLASIRAKV